MQAKRVLVQWLPTPELQDERFLTHGANFTTNVQQVGIELHELEFPAAIVLAQGKSNGYPQLQVGFLHSTRYEQGWLLSGDPDVETTHYFDSEPSKAELIAMALEAAGGLTEQLEARIERMRSLVERMRDKHREQTEKQCQQLHERTQAAEAAVDNSLTAPLHASALPTGPGINEQAALDAPAAGDEEHHPGDIACDTTKSPNWQWRAPQSEAWVDTGVPVVPEAAAPVMAILKAVSHLTG